MICKQSEELYATEVLDFYDCKGIPDKKNENH